MAVFGEIEKIILILWSGTWVICECSDESLSRKDCIKSSVNFNNDTLNQTFQDFEKAFYENFRILKIKIIEENFGYF